MGIPFYLDKEKRRNKHQIQLQLYCTYINNFKTNGCSFGYEPSKGQSTYGVILRSVGASWGALQGQERRREEVRHGGPLGAGGERRRCLTWWSFRGRWGEEEMLDKAVLQGQEGRERSRR